MSGVELEKALQSSFKQRDLNVFENLAKAQEENKNWIIMTQDGRLLEFSKIEVSEKNS